MPHVHNLHISCACLMYHILRWLVSAGRCVQAERGQSIGWWFKDAGCRAESIAEDQTTRGRFCPAGNNFLHAGVFVSLSSVCTCMFVEIIAKQGGSPPGFHVFLNLPLLIIHPTSPGSPQAVPSYSENFLFLLWAYMCMFVLWHLISWYSFPFRFPGSVLRTDSWMKGLIKRKLIFFSFHSVGNVHVQYDGVRMERSE